MVPLKFMRTKWDIGSIASGGVTGVVAKKGGKIRLSLENELRNCFIREEMMEVKRSYVFFGVIALLLMGAGCGSYGKLRLQSGTGETMTTQQLKENWQKYNVLATGVEPNVPSAILFDRKEDGREIIGERWWTLKEGKEVHETIGRIETQGPVGPFYPRLWKVLGPDDHLYGYMVTAWDHAVMTIGDDKTMWVMDLPMPPFLAVGPGGEVRTNF